MRKKALQDLHICYHQFMISIKKPLFLVGDIHGNARNIIKTIERVGLKDISMIFLGDIGIFKFYDRFEYKELDGFFSERKIDGYFFRGNHDNPIFFRNCKRGNDFFSLFKNIKPIRDLEEIEYNGEIGIVIPGGISIDRVWRKLDVSYWYDENMPDVSLVPDKKYDFVLAHTGMPPQSHYKLDSSLLSSFLQKDATLESELLEERSNIDKIIEKISPKKWICGHFHINNVFPYKGTEFIILDIDTIYEFKITKSRRGDLNSKP